MLVVMQVKSNMAKSVSKLNIYALEKWKYVFERDDFFFYFFLNRKRYL